MIIFKWPILILIKTFGVGLKHGIAKGTHVILSDIQSENWPKTLLSFHFLKYMSKINYNLVVSKKNVNLKV
jgi:hypothetical protein